MGRSLDHLRRTESMIQKTEAEGRRRNRLLQLMQLARLEAKNRSIASEQKRIFDELELLAAALDPVSISQCYIVERKLCFLDMRLYVGLQNGYT